MQRLGREPRKIFAECKGRGRGGRGRNVGGMPRRRRRANVQRCAALGGRKLSGWQLANATEARSSQAMLVLGDNRRACHAVELAGVEAHALGRVNDGRGRDGVREQIRHALILGERDMVSRVAVGGKGIEV